MTSKLPEFENPKSAYHAIVSMHEAKWTDKDGSTVTLKLPMAGMEGQRNPFERFTKRRKGHAGTRFFMAISTAESEPKTIYSDEVMLAGWNDSQQNGHTVKFWIANDGMGHPFEGIDRKQELALALAELDDDNEIIDQKMRDRVERQSKKPSERVSFVAAMLCKNDRFQHWVGADDEEGARQHILETVGIQSRAELDSDDSAELPFHQNIRKPFIRWDEEGVPF